jgi:hypothetical protein
MKLVQPRNKRAFVTSSFSKYQRVVNNPSAEIKAGLTTVSALPVKRFLKRNPLSSIRDMRTSRQYEVANARSGQDGQYSCSVDNLRKHRAKKQ